MEYCDLLDKLNDAELAILSLGQRIDVGDRYRDNHCQRLAIISLAIAQSIGLSNEDQFGLFCGGFLHDIGKVNIPDSIRYKNGRLTEAEFAIMKTHTKIGEKICETVRKFSRALPIIRNHHECWDGSGYPDAFSGEAIPILARITQVSDVYDALTTPRPYRRALPPEDAIGEMTSRPICDPRLLRVLSDLPIGELDALANDFVLPSATSTFRRVDFYSCFISHSSIDIAIATRIHEDLRLNGVLSWYAPEDLKIGDPFRAKIDESIKLHDKLLLILSRSSVNSQWVESEVEAALEEERRRFETMPESLRGSATVLFPVRIDDAVFAVDKGWAAAIRRTRHIGDFRGWEDSKKYDLAFRRLLEDLVASDAMDAEARKAQGSRSPVPKARALVGGATKMTQLRKFLRRYTDLPGLVYLLREQCITLVDPQSWDDTNDSHYLTLYREKEQLKSVLALCFTQVSETYHHWRVFANGSSGVCISFRRRELLSAVREFGRVRARSVQYLKLNQLKSTPLVTRELPFLKRYPFEHESEFRLLWESRLEKRETIDIPISLSCLDHVTLSPWLHDNLSRPLKRVIWSIAGCRELKIVRSTLISNEEWKEAGEAALLAPPKRSSRSKR